MNIADYIAVVADGKVSKMGTREEIFPSLMDKTASNNAARSGTKMKEELYNEQYYRNSFSSVGFRLGRQLQGCIQYP
ncbi:hypothetical protein [Ruminococcus sp. HUN007]|uniref:hypothetical protein n=1 Tax=Ruminococcus sp. HUN007 TaxID=1514668 RepID=UPI0018CC52D5